MSVNSLHSPKRPEVVFSVLANGWAYERWVVGCKDIRAVDDGWPAPGTSFHHRVGIGPIMTADRTTVIALDPPRLLVLKARARPFGIAKVTLRIERDDEGTCVTMAEEPMSEWARRLYNPVLDWLTARRNAESLRRLKNLVEERATMGT